MTDLPKFLQRRLSHKAWPQLLIFNEKHGNGYYLCKDQEAVGLACLGVLKDRLDVWICDPGPESEIYGLKEELTKEAAQALPEPYRKQALGVIAGNANRRKVWAEEVEAFRSAEKAVKSKDGNLAYMILSERQDYEYEGFHFETPIVPTK